MAYLASALVADVRRRGMLPSSSSSSAGYTDADILSHANAEMAAYMVPLVMSINEEFYTTSIDVPVTAGQWAYRVPRRNIGGKLRDVQLILGGQLMNLVRLEPEELILYSATSAGTPSAFYLDAGCVNLTPIPGAGLTLRLRYYARPGQLTVTTSDFTRISAITASSATGMTITMAAATAALDVGGICDIISSQSPYEPLLLSGSISGNSGTTLTLSSLNTAQLYNYSAISNFQTGNQGSYICKEGESAIVQLPDELVSLLSWRTLAGVLRQMGHHERLGACEAECERLEKVALRLLAPRVDGEPKKLIGGFTKYANQWTWLR